MATATEAAQSEYFWSWLGMCIQVSDIVSHMLSWLSSCQCHNFVGHECGVRRTEMKHRLGMQVPTPCPMMGLRAPELAVGDFMGFVTDLMELSTGTVLAGLSNCPSEAKSQMLDSQAATNHLAFVLQAELGCSQKTPRVFCGAGHWDQEKARAAVVRGLASWEDLGGR